MPQRLKRKCNKFGCNELTIQSYCAKHEKTTRRWGSKAKDKEKTPEGKRIYDARWTKFRNHYFRNPAKVFCVECKRQGALVIATDLDHITPLAVRPDLKYDEANLQPLCKSCHSRKTAYEFNINRNPKKNKRLIDYNPD